MFLKKNNHNQYTPIKIRLLKGYVFILSISIVLFSLYLFFSLSEILTISSRSTLREKFFNTVTILKSESRTEVDIARILAEKIRPEMRLFGINYALFDDSGQVIVKSSDFIADEKSISELRKSDNLIDETPIEIVLTDENKVKVYMISQVFKIPPGKAYYLQFGLPFESINNALRSFLLSLLLGIPFIIIFCLLGGFILSKRALEPISQLNESIQNVSIEKLDEPIKVSHIDDELNRLIRTINEVFSRLKTAYSKNAQFAGDVSHELRIPIAAIKGEAEVVLGRERNDIEEYRAVLADIIREIDRLMKMINDLFFLARSDSDIQILEKKEVCLEELILELVDIYQVLADERGIKITCHVHDKCLLWADKARLRQLFSNLIDNAIKYNNENGIIEISCEKENDSAIISIKDSGIGIPDSESKAIFERFYRIDKSRSRQTGGAGLGLSISKTIVESHHGTIWAKSLPNSGSIFTVQLPLKS